MARHRREGARSSQQAQTARAAEGGGEGGAARLASRRGCGACHALARSIARTPPVGGGWASLRCQAAAGPPKLDSGGSGSRPCSWCARAARAAPPLPSLCPKEVEPTVFSQCRERALEYIGNCAPHFLILHFINSCITTVVYAPTFGAFVRRARVPVLPSLILLIRNTRLTDPRC